MKAKSIKGKSPEEIQSALQQSMTDGFKPTLAIVFISIKQDIEAICDILDKQAISIFGATSSGEFVDGEIGNESIVILLVNMKRTDFKILTESSEQREFEELTKEMGMTALKHFKNPSFLVLNSMVLRRKFIDGRAILNGIESAVGSNINIWGANAGDDRKYDHTIVFTNQQSFPEGIILLVMDADKIMMKGQAAYGWKPAGTERIITRCENNTIYTIDNQPALDVVFKFLGLKFTKEEAKCASSPLGNEAIELVMSPCFSSQ